MGGPIIYSNDFMSIFNVNKNGAKYQYSKIKRHFNLKRGQYLTIYHLRDYTGMNLEDIIDMLQRTRNNKI